MIAIGQRGQMDDDDYIPFEGPLHKNRGPRKMSQSEIDSLMKTVARLKARRQARTGNPNQSGPEGDRA